MVQTVDAGKYMRFEFGEPEVVGEFLLLSPGDCVNIVELRGFEIYPKHRGKGLSYDMLAFAVMEARTYKFPTMSLKVKRDNAAAVKLYTNTGFVVKREDADRDELEMELDIA